MSVVIVGSGPIGLAAAFELAKRGESVSVVSTSRNVGQAGHVNAGWIVPIMSAPVPAPGALKNSLRWLLDSKSPLKITPELNFEHIAFMFSMLKYSSKKHFVHGFHSLSEFGRGSLSAFDSYIKEGIDFELHRAGVLMAFTSQAELESHAIEFEGVEKYGLAPVDILSAQEMKKREPVLSDLVKCGIDCSDQYFINPSSLISGLLEKCRELRVQFIETSQQIRLEKKNASEVIIRTESQELGGQILIAAGAGTSSLLKEVGIHIPIRFGKGYSFDFYGENRVKNALYLSGAKVAVTPNQNYLRFAGTMEFGGNSLSINKKRAQGILDSSAKYFTSNFLENATAKSGLRPMTPDGLPVIGKLSDFSNLFVASGHAMQGVTLAPNTALAVTQLILDGDSSFDLQSFSPERFQR